MISTAELVRFLDTKLNISSIEDISLNGLQVEGSQSIETVCVAVDAGLSVIQRAIAQKAQLLFVHHGIFWGEPFPIRGAQRELLKSVLESGLNLYAAHLPLDAHEEYGNNFGLARFLGLTSLGASAPFHGQLLGARGLNTMRMTIHQVCERLEELPGGGVQALHFGPEVPEKICIVTGSGAEELRRFQEDDFDTLITGEPRQFAYHFAKENKLNAIFAGHYATETIGVRLVGDMLERTYGLQVEFLDEPTGI